MSTTLKASTIARIRAEALAAGRQWTDTRQTVVDCRPKQAEPPDDPTQATPTKAAPEPLQAACEPPRSEGNPAPDAPRKAGRKPAAPRFVHVPADAETVAWNLAKDAEWRAPRVVPADAATVEWNVARDAEWWEWSVEALARQRWPLVFCDPPRPLALGIHVEMMQQLVGEHGPLGRTHDADAIRRFIRQWVRQPEYLAACAAGGQRYDLDGTPKGDVSEEHRIGAVPKIR